MDFSNDRPLHLDHLSTDSLSIAHPCSCVSTSSTALETRSQFIAPWTPCLPDMPWYLQIVQVVALLILIAESPGVIYAMRYSLYKGNDNPSTIQRVWAHDRRFEPVYQPLLFSIFITVGALYYLIDLGANTFVDLVMYCNYDIIDAFGLFMVASFPLCAFLGLYVYQCSGGHCRLTAIAAILSTSVFYLYLLCNRDEVFIETPLSLILLTVQVPFAYWGSWTAPTLAAVPRPPKFPSSLAASWKYILVTTPLLYFAHLLVAALALVTDASSDLPYLSRLARTLNPVALDLLLTLLAMSAVRRSLCIKEQCAWQWLSFLTPAVSAYMMSVVAFAVTSDYSYLSNALLLFLRQGALGYLGGCIYVQGAWRRATTQHWVQEGSQGDKAAN